MFPTLRVPPSARRASAPHQPRTGSAGPPRIPLGNALGSWRRQRPSRRARLSLAAARGQQRWSLWVRGPWQTSNHNAPPGDPSPAPPRRAGESPTEAGRCAGQGPEELRRAKPAQQPPSPSSPARRPAGERQSRQKEAAASVVAPSRRPAARPLPPPRPPLPGANWWTLPPSPSQERGRRPRPPRPISRASLGGAGQDSYLVDPASSHMLVSKIKPCMCKYELIQTVKLRMAH